MQAAAQQAAENYRTSTPGWTAANDIENGSPAWRAAFDAAWNAFNWNSEHSSAIARRAASAAASTALGFACPDPTQPPLRGCVDGRGRVSVIVGYPTDGTPLTSDRHRGSG